MVRTLDMMGPNWSSIATGVIMNFLGLEVEVKFLSYILIEPL